MGVLVLIGVRAETCPFPLRLVQRDVRTPHECVHVVAVVRGECDAEAGLHHEPNPTDREGLTEHRQEVGGNVFGDREVGDVGEQDGELVSSQTGHCRPFGPGPFQPVSDLADQLVTHLVTECVVDLLEVIEVDHHDGQRLAGAL